MVDCLTYFKMASDTRVVVDPHESHLLEDVPSAEYHLCAPTVQGYSFVSKSWGRFAADQLTEIRWDNNAFEHLVLPEEKKTLVKSIVHADQRNMITDVIRGKSGGFLVVLHGKPGTGKTLTAEAAAEKAQKPLMIVSAAELGNPLPGFGLERMLSDTLYLCETWDAILLIDEAEVYLEARSLGDLHRNAMVSVFLRLLEYHQQVIFLTTNHISRLDAAFQSRIAVAVKYPDLDATAREEIWTRFVTMTGATITDESAHNDESAAVITKLELQELATKEMNGRYVLNSAELKCRQIKNAVRTAQAVASEIKKPITSHLLHNVLGMIGEFSEFEGACECQKKKLGYFGGGDMGSHMQDLKARYGRIPF
jgi:hypothetical protein